MTEKSLFFPHGELSGVEVVIDYLDDNQRRLKRALAEASPEELYWQPDAEGNSIAVTVWHMGRLLDVFFTRQVLGSPPEEEIWQRGGWAAEIGYDPRGIGSDGWGSLNGYTRQEVKAMPRYTLAQLLGYLDEVYDAVRGYLNTTPMKALVEAAPGFDGRYTKYQVISMALNDNIRHLGEIKALKALRERSLRT